MDLIVKDPKLLPNLLSLNSKNTMNEVTEPILSKSPMRSHRVELNLRTLT